MKIISLAFLLIIVGVLILSFDILPFIGWLLIISSFFVSVFDVLLRRSNPILRTTVIIAMFVFCIVAFVIIFNSIGQIAYDGRETANDISVLIGNVIRLFN